MMRNKTYIITVYIFFFTLEWTIHIGHDPSIAKVFLIAQRNTEEELRIFFFLYSYIIHVFQNKAKSLSKH